MEAINGTALTPAQIRAQRRHVADRVLLADPSARDSAWMPTLPALEAMRDAYDSLFFQDALRRAGCLPGVGISGRMTRAAGNFTYARNGRKGEIRLSRDVWRHMGAGPWEVDGVSVQSRLEAVMIVMEHELCHALELLRQGQCRGHGKEFQRFATGFFGHTHWTHALPTASQVAAQAGLRPGTWVRFVHAGKTHTGIIARIYKRVAVMVPDPQGGWCDQRGVRMARYLVPPALLTPVTPP